MGENKTLLRDEVPEKYKWNIEKLYPTVEEWEKDFGRLKIEAPQIKEYEGKLNEGKFLLDFFHKREEILRLTEKLYVYASHRSDEDTANGTYMILKNKIAPYSAVVMSYFAFFEPELMALSDENINEMIKNEPELKKFEFFISSVRRLKKHTLSKEKEEVIAAYQDSVTAPYEIFAMLTDADMEFPDITDENGNKAELTEVKYLEYIRSSNRRVREEAFKNLFGTFKKYKNTLATSLTSSVKNFALGAKLKGYKTSVECSLYPNNIPVEVYENLIDTVNKNLKSLHRYVSVKKKLLNVEKMHMYDLYVPLINTPKEHISFEDGVKTVLKALEPLGKEYTDIFEGGVKNGWIDVIGNKNKRGGAYSGGCYDSMPYVLLNYNYGTDDVSTLAHEMGHSIHSYYSRKNQDYIDADYTLFCAEVASTCNECLLINYLINNEKDKDKKLYYINIELENIRTTLFRQTMFAEFELMTHKSIEEGTPLSPEDLCKMWHELNTKYFGEDMVVDDEIDMEWARIPHFYWDFYVYQYATGYSAANAFCSNILSKKENAVENYKGFLKSGRSNYSIEILKKAGVDMSKPEPILAVIKRFNDLLDMLCM